MTIYRHFKGSYYLVHFIATDEVSGKEIVVYQSLDGSNKIWTRLLEVFQENVPKDVVNPTGQEKRFEKVKDFGNQLSLIPTELLLKELFKRNDNPYDLSADNDKIWKIDYLTGVVIQDENFNVDVCYSTLEEAVKRAKSCFNPNVRIFKRVMIEQDFDCEE